MVTCAEPWLCRDAAVVAADRLPTGDSRLLLRGGGGDTTLNLELLSSAENFAQPLHDCQNQNPLSHCSSLAQNAGLPPCTSQHTYCACACACCQRASVANKPTRRPPLLQHPLPDQAVLAHQQLDCGPNLAGRQQQSQQLAVWCLTSFVECICLALHELEPVRV